MLETTSNSVPDRGVGRIARNDPEGSLSQLQTKVKHTPTHYSACHKGGCQNYGPFWGTLNTRCRTILGTQKGTIILTTTQKAAMLSPNPGALADHEENHRVQEDYEARRGDELPSQGQGIYRV